MNKLLIFSFLIFGFCDILFAQTHQIALVKPDGTTTIHSTFQSAYDAASDNDYVYLPGGVFTIGSSNNEIIDKSIHIHGVGTNADSSSTTGITKFSYIKICDGFSGGTIEGVFFLSNLVIWQDCSNITISNCYITEGIQTFAKLTNSTFKRNFIGMWSQMSLYTGVGCSNSIFSNNFINGHFSNSDTVTLTNNIIWMPNSQLPPNSTFENNIFRDGCGTSNSMFNNNTNVTVQPGNTNFYNNNVTEAWPDIFVDPGPDPYDYNKENDYHVKASSQSHNSGTDGTDRGIYGGPFPWTPGSVPPNPHIISKTINRTSDTNGNLHINVTVGAGN